MGPDEGPEERRLCNRPGPLCGERTGGDGVAVAAGCARAFLIRTQRPDGSWRMNSHPAGLRPRQQFGPIRYVGTAWATMGRVRPSPYGPLSLLDRSILP